MWILLPCAIDLCSPPTLCHTPRCPIIHTNNLSRCTPTSSLLSSNCEPACVWVRTYRRRELPNQNWINIVRLIPLLRSLDSADGYSEVHCLDGDTDQLSGISLELQR
ncbi:hypothetical protein P154DRAFT_108737 [Amniculicola lignicola CBS 123094]|uniref:Uncharacterized protein n=1 Tax=Amniculicola lignicola CBS 123094 TaxID=1392246 RepID=A0A6A5WQ29_9PLEO|nr:hypothetical protein P154DRAFT_108737 [Amniculicola lignicola CBS 123094]